MTDGVKLLTPIQVDVANIFFGLSASEGYVVAGGAALLASDLVARPTMDLDFFAARPVDTVGEATSSLIHALETRGYTVEQIHDSPSFCRLLAARGDDHVLVDLAIDSPPTTAPTMTLLGPTLVALELAGRKMLALFGRAEARDFADIFVLARRFSKDAMLGEAERLDPGFDRAVLAQMVTTLDRFSDDELPLPASEVGVAREFFDRWARELRTDVT